ncbi:hypothetical protein ACVIOG_004799 [Rhizobium leguminosarum]
MTVSRPYQTNTITFRKEILMTNDQTTVAPGDREEWLTRYYFTRAAFSAIWVATALTAGRQSLAVAAALLILYPAWDAAANLIDAARNGGLAKQPQPGDQRRRQRGDNSGRDRRPDDEHELGSRRLWPLGDLFRPAAA